jgi:hypothetical protein
MNESIDTEPTPDYRYFKFRSIDKHLIESLVNSRLYFAKPNALNDPFDCSLELEKSISRAASSATGKRKDFLDKVLDTPFPRDWKRLLENIGVCSFSLNLNETVLWSHYADEHKGLCLLYRFPESFLLDKQNEVLGVDKVKYADDALTDWLKTNAPLEMGNFTSELLKIYLTAKSNAWQYENEARIIRLEHGLFDIPSGLLEQVCFGLRTPRADIELITKLASEHCGCNKFCQMIRGESDFGITAVEI